MPPLAVYPPSPPTDRPLARWERIGLVGLLLVFVAFGGLVELRGALLTRRMTDLGVYLRAAWAVRAGEDIYAITDENEWHYHYPPLFAILLMPLADPPPGADRSGTVPFAVSVGVWYVLSLVCLWVSACWIAAALEAAGSRPARGSRRWWRLRVVPLLICLPAIGGTLMRGQINLLVLACLAGMLAALVHGRSWLAGLCLAGAISLKVIPGLLLLYPLWRRDGRCLAGCAVGLVLGLGIVPALALGPARTWACYEQWAEVLLRPAFAQGADQSRAKELLEVTATDSQSLAAILHNTLYLDRSTRPDVPSRAVRLAHWGVGGTLLLLTVLTAGWSRRGSVQAEVLFVGMLTALMPLLSPVCHLHYFCFALPLVAGLFAVAGDGGTPSGLGIGLGLVLAVNFVANFLPHLPGLYLLRDLGVAAHATLLLWLAAAAVLCLRARPRPAAATIQPPFSAAA
jgi:hypothetical protein